jgi:hypothetical protein
MKSRHGGKLSKATDPDQMVVEAMAADRAAQRRSDLILGPLLLVGGIGITLLSLSVATQGGGLYVVAGGAILTGLGKTVRGIASLFS